MKLYRNIYLLLLCLMLLKVTPQSCDTSKYLKDIIYRQFGGRPVDYKYIEIQEYKNCIKIDTLKKLVLALVADKRKYEYVKHSVENGRWKKEMFFDEVKGCKKDTICRNRYADSLLKEHNKARANDYLNYDVSSFLIELCALYRIQESIPVLKAALVKPKPNHYNKQVIELIKLTLCRLGDEKELNDYLLEFRNRKYTFDDYINSKYDSQSITFYINNQEVYFILSQKLFTKEFMEEGEPGDYYKRNLRNEILTFLVQRIKNDEFQDIAYKLYKKYNTEFSSYFSERRMIDFNSVQKLIPDKEIRLVMEWFKKNKGKYTFS